MKAKVLLLTNLLLIIPLLLLTFTNQSPWLLTLLLISFSSLFTLSLNFWLVPGGFAWRNNHLLMNPSRISCPGPVGWPVLGTLPQMGSLAHRKLSYMANSFNATRLMALSLGSTPVIISSHPETAKEILCGSSFSDRPIKESARLLMFERAIGFALSGSYWRNLRRIAATHMFSPRKVCGLEPLRQQMVDEMLMEVFESMEEERGVVVLREILQKGSLRNMIESVFGRGLGSGKLGLLLGDMVREGYELIVKFNLEDYFPVIGFLDFYGVKRRCHRLAVDVNRVVGQVVKERKQAGDFNSGSDFLSALLSLPEQDKLDDSDMVAVLWV